MNSLGNSSSKISLENCMAEGLTSEKKLAKIAEYIDNLNEKITYKKISVPDRIMTDMGRGNGLSKMYESATLKPVVDDIQKILKSKL